MIESVGIIGSGNVATQLALLIDSKNIPISFIFSPNKENSHLLAKRVNASALKDLSNPPRVDLILVCVSDDSINSVMEELANNNAIIAHTSGAKELHKTPVNSGVFYPFQSISKNETVNWTMVPICVEGNSQIVENKLLELAALLGCKAQQMDSNGRLALHVGGVLLNNFVNHLGTLTHNLLQQHKVSPSLLNSLVEKTAQNILTKQSRQNQTGPAIRGDEKTINRHLELIKNNPQLVEVYKALTKSIQSTKH